MQADCVAITLHRLQAYACDQWVPYLRHHHLMNDLEHLDQPVLAAPEGVQAVRNFTGKAL